MRDPRSRSHRHMRLAVGLTVACAVLGAAGAATAATGDIRTVAGGSAVDGEGVPATSATLWMPRRVAFLPSGGFLVVEFGHGNADPNGRVRKVAANGTITTVAGNGVAGFSGDGGPATAAQMDGPTDIEVLPSGAYLVVDEFNNRVRRVGTDGVITTVAGSGAVGCTVYNGTQAATSARFGRLGVAGLRAMALGPGNAYLLLDEGNGMVHRVTPGADGAVGTADDRITTVAGTCVNGFAGDGGPALSAQLNNPRGVASMSDGGFLIADSVNNRVRRVDAAGTITTVAGTGAASGPTGNGGPATGAVLMTPRDVTEAPDGGFLIAESGRHMIRRVTPAGTISTVAGNGTGVVAGDGGPAVSASILEPHGVNVAPDGDVYISGPGLIGTPDADDVVRAVESPIASAAPPAPGIVSGPRGGVAVNDPTPSWAVLGRFGSSYDWRIRVQGDGLVPGASGNAGTAGQFTSPALADGLYAMESRQTTSGSGSSGYGSATFRVDTAPPVVTRTPAPADPDGDAGWYRSDVRIQVTCGDAGAGVSPAFPCPPSTTVTADGITTFPAVQVRDLAGNAVTAPALQVRRDATPPSAPTVATPDGAVDGAVQQLRWTQVADTVPAPGTDVAGLREYRLTVDGQTSTVAADAGVAAGGAVSWTPPAPLAIGAHQWSLVAVDAAGNASAAAAGTYTVVAQGQTPPTPPPVTRPTPPPTTTTGTPPATRNARALLPTAGAAVRAGRVTLRWPRVGGARVRVELRRLDGATSVRVLRTTVRGRQLRTPRALRSGRYAWSVWRVPASGKVSRTPAATSWFRVP